ncbi:MAG: ribosome silencing factor [Aggregatilineales bacterium]
MVNIAEDRKASDIILLDLRPDAIVADFFVILSGNSDRQLKALIDYLRVGVKEETNKLASSVDGTAESGWVVMDFGDVVVHMFLEEKRQYYDLEGLWSAESNVLLSIQ